MKVAVSLPDEVFEQAEELARSLGVSRSALYQLALRGMLARVGSPAEPPAIGVGEARPRYERRRSVPEILHEHGVADPVTLALNAAYAPGESDLDDAWEQARQRAWDQLD